MPKQPNTDSPRAVRAVVERLESLARAGVTHLPKAGRPTANRRPPPDPPGATAGLSSSAAQGGRSTLLDKPAVAPPLPPPAHPAADPRAVALDQLAHEVAACTRCAELAAKRTQTVFGTGNPHARLVFIGEAPGADEDRTGQPFVGRAGQLLTDIIVKGMKLRREDVYIMNILRCRPPGNRTPEAVEAAACRPFLEAQLAIIQPEFICCLGACAAQNLLASDAAIGRLRGRIHDYHGIKVLCTYHPAYLLRNPDAKRFVWDDIRILMAEMGLGG